MNFAYRLLERTVASRTQISFGLHAILPKLSTQFATGGLHQLASANNQFPGLIPVPRRGPETDGPVDACWPGVRLECRWLRCGPCPTESFDRRSETRWQAHGLRRSW